ncbi:hypothetical protein [Bacteroides uniformis]
MSEATRFRGWYEPTMAALPPFVIQYEVVLGASCCLVSGVV